MFKKILIFFFSLLFFSVAAAEDIFLSLKKNKVNVRYGPSFESPIKYIYKKIYLIGDSKLGPYLTFTL